MAAANKFLPFFTTVIIGKYNVDQKPELGCRETIADNNAKQITTDQHTLGTYIYTESISKIIVNTPAAVVAEKKAGFFFEIISMSS